MARCPAQTCGQQGGQAEDSVRAGGPGCVGLGRCRGSWGGGEVPAGKRGGGSRLGAAGGDRSPVARERAAGRLWGPAIGEVGRGPRPGL